MELGPPEAVYMACGGGVCGLAAGAYSLEGRVESFDKAVKNTQLGKSFCSIWNRRKYLHTIY